MSIGESITLDALECDPYPISAALREDEPVSWVPAVGLWLVTRHDDVRHVDLAPEVFTAASNSAVALVMSARSMFAASGVFITWRSTRHRQKRID